MERNIKNIFNKTKIQTQANRGQAMLFSVVFFVFLSLVIVSGLVAPVARSYKIAIINNQSKQSYYLSESGAEDVYYRIKTSKPVSSPVVISLQNNTATTTITDSNNQKTISSLGHAGDTARTNELVVRAGTGVSFSYGVQTGAGGLSMGSNSEIQGSVYSNGNITGSGHITGSASSANSAAISADQTNDDSSTLTDVTFGTSNTIQDFAQSFEVSTDGPVNKVELYLKKVGTPSNLTVRIVTNNSGVPSTTTLTSGQLSASLVSVNYGWVSVPFSSNPELTAGVKYWIVLDGVTSATKYYITGSNVGGYADGESKIGRYSSSWNNNSPAVLDGFFKLYLGGLTGKIDGIEVGTAGVGNAYAHTIDNANVEGTKFCQSTNNSPACDTSLPDPSQTPMPISNQNILDWKNEAEAGGVHSGDYVLNNASGSIGPIKITGDLILNNNAVLTMTGAIWVEGNIDVSNNVEVNLDPLYGSSEGVIVSDGNIDIGNNVEFSGSGSPDSYIMALSTSTSSSAITLSNNGGAVILYAANGTVNLSNNAQAKSLNGKYINLENNVIIVYDSGLMNSNFVSGPSGGWNISRWRETE